MNKKLIVVLIIIVAIVGLIGYFFLSKRNTISAEEAQLLKTKVIKTVSGNGIVKSDLEADLSFAGGGRITNITKKKGDLVTKGEVLATVNSASQLQSTKALKDARDIALRNRDLFIEQNKENSDDSDYSIKLRTLDEQVSQADASYKASLLGTGDLIIRAPFTGTLVDVHKDIGEIANPGEVVLSIADLTKLYFETELDQSDIGYIKENQDVELNLDSYDNETFSAKVTKLPNYAMQTNTGDELFIIELNIDPTDKPVLLGMTGDANIITDSTNDQASALDFDVINYDENNQPYVWIVENGLLKKQNIEIGLEGDLYTEVITDLSGKTIVYFTNDKIQPEEGKKVVIAKTSQASPQ